MTTPEKLLITKLRIGTNPILLIAPHGRNKDDTNSGKLALAMAKRLKCYVVINEKYRKPDEDKGEKPSKKNKLLDLNFLPDITKHGMFKNYLDHIIKYKDEIKTNHKGKRPLVVLIHGIDDESIKGIYGPEPDIVLGIGLPDRETIDIPQAVKFKNLLADNTNPPTTLICSNDTPFTEDAKKYAGWDSRRLNQLFTFEDSKNYDKDVDSIQLEIKKDGFRDTDDNIKNTAEKLSVALEKLVGIVLPKTEIVPETGKEVALTTKDAHHITFDDEQTNFLIIAPHAHPDDGAATGDIVREIAKLIPCTTIINEEYRKPRVTRYAVNKLRGQSRTTGEDVFGPVLYEKKETISKKNDVLDWFNIKHVEKHLNNEFLAPIKESLILPGNTIVLFVFGISDEKFFTDHYDNNRLAGWEKTEFGQRLSLIGNSKIQATAGDGAKHWRDGTINNDTFEVFIKTLNNNKTFPINTGNILNTSYYAGIKVNDMNQWFSKNGYIKPETQSLTLLLRKQGVRDNQENIEATARTIANALNMVVESTKTEEDVNKSLVSETAQKITNIFHSHVEDAMLEIGRHLIEKYYGSDFRRAKHNKAIKDQSLHYLIKNIQKNDPNAPSQAWLYRSIQMAVENRDMEKALPDNFYTYRNLSLSHKVLLLPISDIETKKKLIDDITDNNLTVAQLREMLSGKALEGPKTLSQVITKPNLLFSEDFAPLLAKKNLNNLKPKEVAKIASKAEEQIKRLQDDVAEKQDYIKKYGKLLKLVKAKGL